MYLCLVFVGCSKNNDHWIYSAQVQQDGTRLEFNKTVSTLGKVLGISHQENPKQLFYTVAPHSTLDSIYKCDFTGANNEEVIGNLIGNFNNSCFIIAFTNCHHCNPKLRLSK